MAADVMGLYLDLGCARGRVVHRREDGDPGGGPQARMLPLSPGRAHSHGFEYKPNGTLSLFAALDTPTGRVLGKTAALSHQRAVRDISRRHRRKPVQPP